MTILVDNIETVVTAMRNQTVKLWADSVATDPYYMYGHRLEINNRLKEKNDDETFKYQKYPLVALRMDFEEKVNGGFWDYSLNIAILASTEKNYNTEERMANVFIPILYPLYEAFMNQLKKVGLFQWDRNMIYPPHTKIDRPYYGTGTEEQNVKNFFSDPLDAVEIIGLNISSIIKKC